MGVEAVTKAVVREHMRKTSKTEEQLAVDWHVNDPDKLKRRKGIEVQARRRLVFKDDAECLKLARAVSDGFEHGFSDFGTMRKPAEDVIVKTAAYLRQAILETVGIASELLERALGPKYSSARGPLMIVRYIRGTLTGAAEHLAAEGHLYPMFHWKSGLKKVQIGGDGTYEFTPKEDFTADFGQGVSITHLMYEAWDGSKIMEQAAVTEALTNIKVSVKSD
jgi:hypothetical protein